MRLADAGGLGRGDHLLSGTKQQLARGLTVAGPRPVGEKLGREPFGVRRDRVGAFPHRLHPRQCADLRESEGLSIGCHLRGIFRGRGGGHVIAQSVAPNSEVLVVRPSTSPSPI
jgi:hypothetical protein